MKKLILIVFGTLLFAIIIAVVGYIYNNLNYYKAPLKKTKKAGFKEKQVTLEDGTVLNYAEGPNNGPPLLLIHGQIMSWKDYATVLPELAEYYHIYAIDCHGHGKSSNIPEKYSAEEMGHDFEWFIENIIGEPAIVSGHSSGGLLTSWLAANSPENVIGIILEDPPFFSTEATRCEKTFSYIDTFVPAHKFINQSDEDDFTLYYLKNCYSLTFFGNAREKIIKYGTSYREKHLNSSLKIFFLPPIVTRIYLFMDSYDPKFGDTFYDCSWMKNFDHAETLSRINCPSILIHANWKYDDNGILLAAMDDNDAERVHSLIKNNVLIDVETIHNVHCEKPREFIKTMIDFLKKIK